MEEERIGETRRVQEFNLLGKWEKSLPGKGDD
jgi:hypothetical protein